MRARKVGYSAKSVANYFLSKYGKHGISPLKMQKLVYVAHGWHLAFHDEPLVADEYPEAWRYGPVFQSLYHEFKHRGRSPIIDPATDLGPDLKETVPRIDKEDRETRRLLDRIWEVYGGYSGLQLSAMCHQDGTPWAEARKGGNARRNTHIDDKSIQKYYRKKRERNRK